MIGDIPQLVIFIIFANSKSDFERDVIIKANFKYVYVVAMSGNCFFFFLNNKICQLSFLIQYKQMQRCLAYKE